MLHFGLNPITNQFDTKIDGLGISTYVSEIENTDLKQPKVSKNIPTVAEVTQVCYMASFPVFVVKKLFSILTQSNNAFFN